MGLVTSFINQIGREIGRDTYRSLVSKKLKNNDDFFSPFTDNSIYDEVIHFELRATEDETFRRLANLVERAEHADPEDFDWQELFYEIDNKIEFCKTHLSSEYAPKLDQLDTINAANYHKIKSLHINYIDSLINQVESNLNEENSIGTGQIIVRSLIGLRTKNSKNNNIYTFIRILCLLAIILFFISGYLSYVKPAAYSGNLASNTSNDLDKVRSIGVFSMALSAGFYMLYFLIGLRQLTRKKSITKELFKSKESLIKYKSQLLRG